MDLGSSVCALGGVGKAHYLHSHNLDPDAAKRAIDDPYTIDISWPNFHSGGAPSFVNEPPGDGMARVPEAIADTHRYVRNAALWLAWKPAGWLKRKPPCSGLDAGEASPRQTNWRRTK